MVIAHNLITILKLRVFQRMITQSNPSWQGYILTSESWKRQQVMWLNSLYFVNSNPSFIVTYLFGKAANADKEKARLRLNTDAAQRFIKAGLVSLRFSVLSVDVSESFPGSACQSRKDRKEDGSDAPDQDEPDSEPLKPSKKKSKKWWHIFRMRHVRFSSRTWQRDLKIRTTAQICMCVPEDEFFVYFCGCFVLVRLMSCVNRHS